MYVKESESTKQDIALPHHNQEHVTIIYTTMATCVASTRSSSRKTLKKCKQLFHLQIDAHCRASIKHDFTDDTEIEQAGGELTPKKAKNDLTNRRS